MKRKVQEVIDLLDGKEKLEAAWPRLSWGFITKPPILSFEHDYWDGDYYSLSLIFFWICYRR